MVKIYFISELAVWFLSSILSMGKINTTLGGPMRAFLFLSCEAFLNLPIEPSVAFSEERETEGRGGEMGIKPNVRKINSKRT